MSVMLRQPERLPVHHLLEHLAGRAAVAERRVPRHPLEVHGERLASARRSSSYWCCGAHALHDRDQFRRPSSSRTRSCGRSARPGPGWRPGTPASRRSSPPRSRRRRRGGPPSASPACRSPPGRSRRPSRRPSDSRVYASSMNSTPPRASLEDLGGLDGRAADDLRDQVGPGDLDQVPGAQRAQLGEDPAVQPGHGRLAGAGRAGEDQVPAHRRRGHAEPGAALGELVEVDQRAHLLLDVVQADQGVEFGQRPSSPEPGVVGLDAGRRRRVRRPRRRRGPRRPALPLPELVRSSTASRSPDLGLDEPGTARCPVPCSRRRRPARWCRCGCRPRRWPLISQALNEPRAPSASRTPCGALARTWSRVGGQPRRRPRRPRRWLRGLLDRAVPRPSAAPVGADGEAGRRPAS